MALRPVGPADHPALLALNNRHAEAVNALDAADFAARCAGALLALAAWEGGRPLGFLLAFGPSTPEHGPNHRWMRLRHPEAAYIDRIVVEAAAQGRGIGRRLYAALAASPGVAALGCEVNLDPPNPASMAFHLRLGFRPAGQATDPRNGKRVEYLLCSAARFLRNQDKSPLSGAARLNTSQSQPPGFSSPPGGHP
ncbi:GNAT family N-acetyltransferase [Pseudoroseomonas rhizosphaerae]|uniref:GNAT family N-acetyltransferase n=1 Tax=Teichococcus rhizosphaerae TaxID=1335062 RepID=A0A2C6Z8J9_9PROT|nr:GNAT family N-acetyltransferase [Pseudoroseomonas rhizosphaerae]PHK94821.1 GNAT family N-acetyltransferase [Pseudoroseomonas rhizosphaerae]